ncbi:hypothetical protein RvY_13898 [Ramazzottius varieornatus]|uniref:Uncharacterized protein n=1 Tax=Ramazzottius varieornatus TaxID=947166 RepID=A0A1D1VPG3_RAMVA|nr:hypothetical protein RvY_13898 [Ramazzottius varieornatus]
MLSHDSLAEGSFQHNGQNYRIGHKSRSANLQHQHSAPATSKRDGNGHSQGSVAGSVSASYSGDEDTPRTSASERHKVQSDHALARTVSAHAPLIGSSYEIAALRKHVKILEERLRAERHTHAVKFSEVEKQLIQENARLKVSTSALQRQIKREEQKNADNEAELSKLRKERKSRFSLSGITRSFSDVRLEDIEMQESSLKRKNTDSEVVRMIKERLQDSEKDRLEAEGVFNQRISTLLRERNVQRTEMQSAEEAMAKLTSENEALHRSAAELRTYIANIDPSLQSQGDSLQMANLRRSNQQLQEELQQFVRERNKLVVELEDLSEELTLAKANDRQNKEQHHLLVEMKSKVDSLRNNMVPSDRHNGLSPVTATTSRTKTVHNGPSFSPSTSREVDLVLEATTRELGETRNQLASILELSQRYELHCYNLEKELSKFYGKNYQYVETGWRKKDRSFLEKLSQTVKKGKAQHLNSNTVQVHTSSKPKTLSAQSTQTEAVPLSEPLNLTRNSSSRNAQMEELLKKVNSIIELIDKMSPNTSPLDGRRRAVQGQAIAQAVDDLLTSLRDGQSNGASLDLAKLNEARLEVQALQRAITELQAHNDFLRAEVGRLTTAVKTAEDADSQFDDEDTPITQAEVEEKIRQVRSQLVESVKSKNSGLLPANVLSGFYQSPLTDYTAKTSGVWSYSESNSSNGEDVNSPIKTPLPLRV